MTNENWNSVEFSLDEIKSEIDRAKETLSLLGEIKLGLIVKDAHNTIRGILYNIEQHADSIYSTCEGDYCDTDDEPEKEIPTEILGVLPTNITLGQAIDLADTIKEWRRKNGLGIYD
jgi:hypothetical protein